MMLKLSFCVGGGTLLSIIIVCHLQSNLLRPRTINILADAVSWTRLSYASDRYKADLLDGCGEVCNTSLKGVPNLSYYKLVIGNKQYSIVAMRLREGQRAEYHAISSLLIT